MKKLLLWALLIMVACLAGCKTETLTADSLPWVSDKPVMFMDDFTHQTGGWQTYTDRLSFAGYAQNGFRLWVDLPNYQIWSVPGLNFRDTHIYTQAHQVDGPDNNLFGLLCRFQDEQNFYSLVISSDGYFGIFKKLAGVQTLVDLPQMGFSEVIKRDGQPNEIMAVCQGDQLALLVNETKLLQVTDSSLSYGDVGVIVGNLSEPGADILFDYFIVVKP